MGSQPRSPRRHSGGRQEIAAAARAANRREILQSQLEAEVAGENRPAVIAKISAETRLLDKAVTDHLARVHVGLVMAQSQRHQRAVDAPSVRQRETNGG